MGSSGWVEVGWVGGWVGLGIRGGVRWGGGMVNGGEVGWKKERKRNEEGNHGYDWTKNTKQKQEK